MARRAFTLVEMLVVLALVLVLATLLIAFGPRMAEKHKAAAGADQLQQWLLIAKQRALRDRSPTGLRLIPDTDNPSFVRKLRYVQLPADLRFQRPMSVSAGSAPGRFDYVDLGAGPGENFRAGSADLPGYTDPAFWTVQPGDFIQFPDLTVHKIGGADSTGAVIGTPVTPTRLQLNWSGAPASPINSSTLFSIFRSSRPILGEQELLLPEDIVIDLGTNTTYAVPLYQGFSGYPEIVFGTDGPMINTPLNGKAILWVRDVTQGTAEQTLIVVYGRTGFIAAHQVDVTPSQTVPGQYANPYSFTQDGRSSGL